MSSYNTRKTSKRPLDQKDVSLSSSIITTTTNGKKPKTESAKETEQAKEGESDVLSAQQRKFLEKKMLSKNNPACFVFPNFSHLQCFVNTVNKSAELTAKIPEYISKCITHGEKLTASVLMASLIRVALNATNRQHAESKLVCGTLIAPNTNLQFGLISGCYSVLSTEKFYEEVQTAANATCLPLGRRYWIIDNKKRSPCPMPIYVQDGHTGVIV